MYVKYNNGELFPPCRVSWRTGHGSDSILLCRTRVCTFLYILPIATRVFASTGVFIADVPSVVYGNLRSQPISSSFFIKWSLGNVKFIKKRPSSQQLQSCIATASCISCRYGVYKVATHLSNLTSYSIGSSNYCVEGGSPLHVCYLDARAAFDCVWISCLLYKLHDKGIGGNDLRNVFLSLHDQRWLLALLVHTASNST